MPSRYYKRRRALPIYDGENLTEPVEALTTRYYFGLTRKKPHNVYYFGGVFYRHVNAPVRFGEDGTPREWVHAMAPIKSATCFDRFLSQTLEQGKAAPVTLVIEDGRAVSAIGCEGTDLEGVRLIDGTEPTDYLEDLLDLKCTERKRPGRKAA